MKTKAGPNSSGKKTNLYGGWGHAPGSEYSLKTYVFPKFLFTTSTCIMLQKGDGSEIKASFLASCWHLR